MLGASERGFWKGSSGMIAFEEMVELINLGFDLP